MTAPRARRWIPSGSARLSVRMTKSTGMFILKVVAIILVVGFVREFLARRNLDPVARLGEATAPRAEAA